MEIDFGYLKDFKYRYPNRKLYSLMDKVWDSKTLEEAWKRVYANKGCAGVDKITILEFRCREKHHLREIQHELKTGRYEPLPVLRKHIPKRDGKLRPLGVPAIKDRIVQQAVRMVLEPVFEMKFLDCNYGYRTGRNAHQAIKRLDYYRTGKNHRWILDGDIKGFFDNVDHELLVSFVAEEISDSKVLNLITKWLKAGVMIEGKGEETRIGTPQGGVISPLLANIYLHEFDKYMTERGHNLIRYADDFVVICSTKKRAEKALSEAKAILGRLKLKLHPEKTRIVHIEKMQFLGFSMGGNKQRGIKPRDEAVKEFRHKIKEMTRRHKTLPVKEVIRCANRLINGWGHYYKIGKVKVVFRNLDIYVRKRFRIYIEKKISAHSRQRLSNYTLAKEYGLKSLSYLYDKHIEGFHTL